ncbi:phosphoglycerate kinase [Candidatus Pacearchaeota archaeon]|nr:phosphoglycerate kinase [Candidatus Pacearchaeota archaeon]
MKTLSDFNFKGKSVLLRVDINSPVKGKKVLMNERIEEAAKSIKSLQDKKAKVVVLAHQGRKGDSDFISLEQHSRLLNKIVKIKFVSDIIGEKAVKEIKALKEGEALLLENVRFLEEENNLSLDNKFVRILSGLAEIYVNDAFSVSHREQASIVSFPKIIKSCAGINLEKELEALSKIKIKDALYILGGSKTEENLLLIQPGRKIITAGMFGQLCMLASDFKFGKHEEFLDIKNLEITKNTVKNISLTTPEDFAVKEKGKRKELELKDFPNDYEIFDIGKKTIEKFKTEIKKAECVFMKGPLGYCEDKQFQKGTKEILEAISSRKIFSVIGGGHLSAAISYLHINKKKFSHISLSGGALVSYLSGKNLPGIDVLEKKHQ